MKIKKSELRAALAKCLNEKTIEFVKNIPTLVDMACARYFIYSDVIKLTKKEKYILVMIGRQIHEEGIYSGERLEVIENE